MIQNRLEQWMQTNGISANQLHADTAISLNTIRAIRRNTNAPIAPQTLATICDTYKISVSSLQSAGYYKGRKWIEYGVDASLTK
jgi:DNA-binding Xre family transcriptional regulator